MNNDSLPVTVEIDLYNVDQLIKGGSVNIASEWRYLLLDAIGMTADGLCDKVAKHNAKAKEHALLRGQLRGKLLDYAHNGTVDRLSSDDAREFARFLDKTLATSKPTEPSDDDEESVGYMEVRIQEDEEAQAEQDYWEGGIPDITKPVPNQDQTLNRRVCIAKAGLTGEVAVQDLGGSMTKDQNVSLSSTTQVKVLNIANQCYDDIEDYEHLEHVRNTLELIDQLQAECSK